MASAAFLSRGRRIKDFAIIREDSLCPWASFPNRIIQISTKIKLLISNWSHIILWNVITHPGTNADGY